MIDTRRIVTGYDVEVLLGAGYFLPIFQAAHDVGELPATLSIPRGPGEPPTLVQVQRPDSANILNDDDANLSVTTLVRATVFDATGQPTEAELGVTVRLLVQVAGENISLSVVGFDVFTRAALTAFGVTDEQIGQVEDQLRATDRTLPLDLDDVVAPMVTRVVSADGDGVDAAIALYMNLDLKIAPQSERPETTFIPRGDAQLGRSFLPDGKSFAIGVSPATFERFANDSFHSFFAEDAEGNVTHPVIEDGEIVGDYKSIAMKLNDDGSNRITIRLRGFVDHFPDVPVKIKFDLRPTIDDGKLGFDVTLESFDADAGLLNDVIGYLVGGALAVLVTAIFGPAAPLVLLPVLQAAGVVTIEILANKVGDEKEGSAAEQADSIGAQVTQAFSAFPTELLLFVDERDPFFARSHFLLNRFDEIQMDEQGFGMAGRSSIRTSTRFPLTSLVARTRGDGPNSRFGLESLVYRISDFVNIPLPMREVLHRIGRSELAQVAIVPSHVRRVDTIVTDIKFDSDVDLTVAEVVALHEERVVRIPGFQVIDPKGANAYVRSVPDETTQNNLERLPGF